MPSIDDIRDDNGQTNGHNDNGQPVDGDDGLEPLDTERLALDDDDNDRLPWLDADDDDEDESDGGRILGFALLGLIALVAIVGGIWWSTHRKPDHDMVADGGLITAPKQPYKEAPKSPGGKTFEGTGDTAFAVSEGQTRPAKLGETGSSPSPTPDVAKAPASASPSPVKAAPTPAASASRPAPPPAASGPVVQVGAYSTRASAEAAWGRMSQQYSALSGAHHQIVEGKADIGTVYRLQVVTGEASALCGRLKSAGLACQVK